MAQEQIKGQAGDLGSGGSLDVYDVPGSAIITPYAISATIDGSGAGGSFLPCLTFKTITGAVIARCPAPTIAAGGSAEVSWFPHVGGTVNAANVAFGGARIYSSVNQTIADNTATDITFDTVDIDTLGMANLGVNDKILTATVSGFYLVAGILDYDFNYLGREVIHVTVNGYYSAGTGTFVTSAQAGILGNFTQPLEATGLVYMNAGDFVSLGTLQTSGGPVSTTGNVPENIYSHSLFAALIGA